MRDTVYVDAKKTKTIVAIKPKPPFKPIFQVAASHHESNIRILNEPLEGSSVFLVETEENQTLPETTLHFVESSFSYLHAICLPHHHLSTLTSQSTYYGQYNNPILENKLAVLPTSLCFL